MLRVSLLVIVMASVANPAFAETPADAPPSPLNARVDDDPMLAEMPRAAQDVVSWNEVLALMHVRSTELRTAYNEILRAEAQERIALANVLPTMTGTVTAAHQVGLQLGGFALTSASINTLSATAQFQQTLYNGEQFYALSTAKGTTRAAELSEEDEARTLVNAAANAILGVVTAERVAEVNRASLRQALERLDLTERRERTGSVTGLDVIRAEEDVESVRTTLISGDESVRKSRETLGLALGLPRELGVAKSIRIEGLESDATGTCRATGALEDRADIRAQKQRVVVAVRQINDVWWQFVPSISAQGSATKLDSNIAGPMGTPTWNIQAVLTVPIWDGGARYGLLRNARAVADEAAQTLEADLRQATVQLEQARRAVDVARRTLVVQERARDLAVRSDDMTRTLFARGNATSLDLVSAAASRRQAEIQYAISEYNFVESRIGARLAVATCGWRSPETSPGGQRQVP
jgi:outer membrane protein TolC